MHLNVDHLSWSDVGLALVLFTSLFLIVGALGCVGFRVFEADGATEWVPLGRGTLHLGLGRPQRRRRSV